MSFLSTVSGKDVAEKTRNVLKRLMSDSVQMQFNYEGRGQKNKRGLNNFPFVLSVVFGM